MGYPPVGRGPGKPRIGIKNRAKYNADVEVRTAHDVRKLVGCSFCTGLGTKENMIREAKDSFIHGRCFVARDGVEAILALPKDVTDGLTIGDIGGPVMKKLIKQNYGG